MNIIFWANAIVRPTRHRLTRKWVEGVSTNVYGIQILSILSGITNKFVRYHKNSISTYDIIAFRDFQIDYCKTVVSGTCDGLAANGKHGLHLRYWNWLNTN